jgi:hypothetical protein
MTVSYKDLVGANKTTTINNPRNKYAVGDAVRINKDDGQLETVTHGIFIFLIGLVILGLSTYYMYFIFTNDEFAKTMGIVDVFDYGVRGFAPIQINL